MGGHARVVEELPVQVRRVRVDEPRLASHYARVHAYEEHDEAWGDGVAESREARCCHCCEAGDVRVAIVVGVGRGTGS